MSHEITATDKTLSVREMPWMGLLDGQVNVLPEYPSREEAQKLVLDWEPVEAPVFKQVPVINDDGTLGVEYVAIEGSKIRERSDNGDTLGVVNESLGLVKNNDVFDVVEAIGKVGTDILIETAGSLRGGRDIWVLLRLAEPFHIKGDPNGETVAFFAIQNNLVANGSFRGQGVNTRIVCKNTSGAADVEAKNNGFEFVFRNTKNVQDHIDDAKAAVSMWREGVTLWRNAMDHLADVDVTGEQVEEFVQQFQPMPRLATKRVQGNVEKARQEVRDILASETCEGINRKALGLFQSAIEWDQWFRQTKGKDPQARMESHFRRSMLSHDSLRRDTLALVREVSNA